MVEMKDFDGERHARREQREKELGERTFVLCGERFTYRAEVSYTVLERISEQGNLDGGDLIQSIEAAVLDLLEPGQEERFLAVARNTDDPLTFEDLNSLATWLTEVQVSRPTQVPSPSTPGDESTSTSLTAVSSSPPAEASAA